MDTTTKYSNLTLSTYQDPSDYRSEIMEIYIWPFVFVVVYATVGCLGNVLVLYIYFFKWQHTQTRIFILALAGVDFLNTGFNMPIEAVILWDPMQFDHHNLCKTTRGITFVINNVSACILVAIAIDRVLCVYKPLKRRSLTLMYAKWSCVIAILIGTVTGWPGFVFYGTATLPEKLDTVTVLGKTCLIADEFIISKSRWPFIYSIILFALMITVFIILSVLYIMIGRKLYVVNGSLDVYSVKRKASLMDTLKKIALGHEEDNPESRQPDLDKRRVSFKVSAKTVSAPRGARMCRRISGTNLTASRDNTVTMAMVTVAFMVSFLPYLIIVTLRYINSQFYFDLTKNEKIAYHVFLRQYFLNSVINPFIYSFANKQFRSTVMTTFKQAIERIKTCCVGQR